MTASRKKDRLQVLALKEKMVRTGFLPLRRWYNTRRLTASLLNERIPPACSCSMVQHTTPNRQPAEQKNTACMLKLNGTTHDA